MHLLLKQAWSSQEFSEEPSGYVIDLTPGLAARILELAGLVKDHGLSCAKTQWAFDEWGFADVGIAGLAEPVDASLVADELAGREFLVLPEAASAKEDSPIRGHEIQVFSDGWSLRCYDKYSDVEFESSQLSLPVLNDGVASMPDAESHSLAALLPA